ncbi:outer membrane protein assembly factor BamE domain-containing protein [Candidatus Pelagibacter communis]|uniref:outer membrane protein assembly factor BamE domain-containing protein n=1 Tax=Pelagibacter ubique TaxID=198252 RepID=UPI00092D3795|nr:outer membrane protein assembly factor BamE [Candidatus Pelagibacter ubique]
MYKLFYIIFIILVAASCSINPIDNYHGVAFLEKKQKKLSINKSNKNDIIKILGAPSTESILENDLWIYIENRKSKSSLFKLGKEIVLTNNVLVLEIDKKGILKNKKFYDINDLNKINFNKNETKMSDKDSFVYGVLSSLRQKIDSTKRNKK